ncbi:tRNA (Guanosine(18)-2'-O)-methyltransferase [Rhynchospora pubera]|uniref:tRNA (Guanosine(18)-2'-O)-methyltransferase n=1 Tax=Rhynchospora pubera TaxID=906938 RepID=A0AAV8HHK8_9POAL|nr:tRNA (Guanosine(18)-2'-O)-methyltransferase [Rhynchospora pubera]
MSTSKTLAFSSLAIHKTVKSPSPPFHQITSFSSPFLHFPFLSQRSTSALHGHKPPGASFSTNLAFDSSIDSQEDTVAQILTKPDRIERLMKMQRRKEPVREDGVTGAGAGARRWFPYLDLFRSGEIEVSSKEIIDVLDPYIMEARKERIQRAVSNRTYSLCLVVEGLTDFGNVSAAFRSADALGVQSVHVISCDSSKRYRDNRHVSMGSEKWLDIELWDSPAECFTALRNRGYRIATTCLGPNSVSVYELDWSRPTAIVVGNENMGISEEAICLSDLHCSIPMRGMIDSFNVSVASGILMHHAVCDRTSRLGCHGDLAPGESQILLAEFYLRHRESTIGILHEYAKRKGHNNMHSFNFGRL